MTVESQSQVTDHSLDQTVDVLFRSYPRLRQSFLEVLEHPGAMELLHRHVVRDLVCAVALLDHRHWLQDGGGIETPMSDEEVESFWLDIKRAGARYLVGTTCEPLWSFAEGMYADLFHQTIPRKGWRIPRNQADEFRLMRAFALAFRDMRVSRRRIVAQP